MSDSQLGDYLRARRELVRPEDVGLSGGGRRGVPGLRSEEVASLAGVSGEDYLRLEQGRDRNPSPRILDALARVLLLDHEATRYLHTLAAPATHDGHGDGNGNGDGRAEAVPDGIQQLITTAWSHTPAAVLNRYMDVLAANPLGRALSPANEPGANAIRAAFLDPAVRALYVNWSEMTVRAVAGLRALIGPYAEDPRVVGLVDELSVKSLEFRRLWARHDVSPRGAGASRMDHPRVGLLELRHERLLLAGTDGQLLVVHHAEPGSESARRLAELADLAATRTAPSSS
jgi:transcriptional regulator with XRE-family HTH domain